MEINQLYSGSRIPNLLSIWFYQYQKIVHKCESIISSLINTVNINFIYNNIKYIDILIKMCKLYPAHETTEYLNMLELPINIV